MESFEEFFYYDKTSPSGLRWKIDRLSGRHLKINKCPKDSPVGYKHLKNKRWVVFFNYKSYCVHRIIWTLLKGDCGNLVIDHINGDPFNNDIENLRLVTSKINSRNKKKLEKNTSGITGVHMNVNRSGNSYWVSRTGKESKYFSIDKLGNDLAKSMAENHRKQTLKRLNEEGYGYTERHGND
jgi:hypothetical protein